MKIIKNFEDWKVPSWLAKLSNFNAKCDECGYKEELNVRTMTNFDVDSLLNKKCPECGHIMLNDKDISLLKIALKRFNLTKPGEDVSNYAKVRYKTKQH